MVAKKADQEQTALAKKNQSAAIVDANNATPSERFTTMVMREFVGTAANAPELTPHQKRLIQNYFISTDLAIKSAEEKRLKKTGKYQDKVPVTWENVNLPSLSLNVVACSRIGFDPALPNHINMIPYKNNNTGKYDIGFLEGYRGKELKAMKYGYNPPDDIVVEVVYSNDTFKPIKKDRNNEVETYLFEIEDAFDRGEIIGGFYYHVYTEQPHKNVLIVFNKAQIEKRKPKYAAAEFWGGTKPIYKDGKKTAKTEKIEGWYAEMVWKTIYRAAYGSITIDSEKIDDNLMALMQSEQKFDEFIELSGDDKQQVIEEKANKKNLSMDQDKPANHENAEHPVTTDEAFESKEPQPDIKSVPKDDPEAKKKEDAAYEAAMADANAQGQGKQNSPPF
ncbi:MAG TPA: recombinational DNA repair protein (RecE pathway) [bacterium]|nr:recombinational DNA repair protein (RecE pathway) [bacterium]